MFHKIDPWSLSLSIDEEVDDAEGKDLTGALEDVDVRQRRIGEPGRGHLPRVERIRNFGVSEPLRNWAADLADVLNISGQSSAEEKHSVLDADPGRFAEVNSLSVELTFRSLERWRVCPEVVGQDAVDAFAVSPVEHQLLFRRLSFRSEFGFRFLELLLESDILDVFDLEDSFLQLLLRIFGGQGEVGQLGLFVNDLKSVFLVKVVVGKQVISDECEVALGIFRRNRDGAWEDWADEVVFGLFGRFVDGVRLGQSSQVSVKWVKVEMSKNKRSKIKNNSCPKLIMKNDKMLKGLRLTLQILKDDLS